MHFDLFQRISIDPTSVSVVALSPYGPRVVRVNDNGPLKLEPEKEHAAETPQIGGVAADAATEAPAEAAESSAAASS
jgi:hypothetical protein